MSLKIPKGGGGLEEGRGRGAGRVSAANWGFWGGGAKYFFFGAEMSTKLEAAQFLPKGCSRKMPP